MRLASVELTNFRGFPSATFKISATGITLIAGANNAGKTALLTSLDVVADPRLVRDLTSKDTETAVARIVAEFELSESEVFVVRPANPNLPTNAMSRLFFSFAADPEFGNAQLVRVEGLWGPSPHPLIQPAARPDRRGDVEYSDWSKAQYINQPPPVNGHTRGQIEEAMSNVSALKPILDLLQDWRSAFYHVRALRTGGDRSSPMASTRRLETNGGNVHQVLLHLLTNEPTKFQEIRDLLQAIVPDVGSLALPTEQNSVAIAMERSDGISLNLKDLGTGVEQLLLTLVVGVTQEHGGLFVIEEPETNLHAAAQRALLTFLRDVAARTNLILATHSSVFLDDEEDGETWLVRRSGTISSVELVRGAPLEILRELGIRLSDVLSADKLIIVEGKSDIEILRTWFKRDLLTTKCAISDGGGGDSARHAELLDRWMQSADSGGRRQIVYLRDRDELPEDLIERLERSGLVKVLPRREVENYLLEAEAIARYASLQRPGVRVATEEEIDEQIDQAVYALRTTMVFNRVSRQLSPIYLVSNRDRDRLRRRGVSRTSLAQHVVDQLPKRPDLKRRISTLWREAESYVDGLNIQELRRYAPGEEVLGTIFRSVLGRGFSKTGDGPGLAAHIAPPEEVRALLTEFLAD